jgi:hypothetical protein
MRRVIVFVSLLVVLSLFAFDEDFPFGMNFSVYKTFKDTTPELTEYIWKYKAAMDSTAYGLGVGWWRAQLKFRWGDMQPYEGEWVWDDEDSLVKWTGSWVHRVHSVCCVHIVKKDFGEYFNKYYRKSLLLDIYWFNS